MHVPVIFCFPFLNKTQTTHTSKLKVKTKENKKKQKKNRRRNIYSQFIFNKVKRRKKSLVFNLNVSNNWKLHKFETKQEGKKNIKRKEGKPTSDM